MLLGCVQRTEQSCSNYATCLLLNLSFDGGGGRLKKISDQKYDKCKYISVADRGIGNAHLLSFKRIIIGILYRDLRGFKNVAIFYSYFNNDQPPKYFF